MSQAKCDNCGHVCEEGEVKPARDLNMRLDPGSIVPSGECPKCGALAYPLKGLWFKTEWADGMDGGTLNIAKFVNHAVVKLAESDLKVTNSGDGVDMALAAIMIENKDKGPVQVLADLDYAINQLQIVRNNIADEVENG